MEYEVGDIVEINKPAWWSAGKTDSVGVIVKVSNTHIDIRHSDGMLSTVEINGFVRLTLKVRASKFKSVREAEDYLKVMERLRL